MIRTTSLYLSAAAIAAATLSPAPLQAQQSGPPRVSIGDSDLGGVVSGPNGPEAGVWVIAETTDLPTKFAKIVVTDDQGRYVIPDLPNANYQVWVRGYGLVDSPKVTSTPGKMLDLTAVPAPNAAAAAEYYPAIYWYSMLKVPDKSEFPGTGPQGNGMGRDAGYHEREAVRLRARNRFGADQPAATDPVLDVELPAEGSAQCVGIEPAERIGGTAGRKRHHDAHRLARPFRGCGAGNRQHDAGEGGEHALHVQHWRHRPGRLPRRPAARVRRRLRR